MPPALYKCLRWLRKLRDAARNGPFFLVNTITNMNAAEELVANGRSCPAGICEMEQRTTPYSACCSP
jgi:hypothetical protein